MQKLPLPSLSLFTAVFATCVFPFNLHAEEKKPFHFAHRGGAYEFEENTLFAFKSSYEKGIKGFELDVRLTKESLGEAKVRNNMVVASDGVEAMACLRREGRYANAHRPDLILLDLNLPRMNGFEVLDAINRSYDLYANAYVNKPVDLEQFIRVIKSIEDFWLEIVKLPNGKHS